MKKRIAIVVDHPLRDLAGCVLTASELVSRGADVYLVPMNLQKRELFALAPDFVLLNYLRKNNEDIVHALRECSIEYGVLDTEGGFYGTLEKYGRVLSLDRELIDDLSCYCSWGDKVKNYMSDEFKYRDDQLVTTGVPRFDFYHGELFHGMKERLNGQADGLDDIFLINTKVALANPQFVSKKAEIELYKKSLKIPDEEIEKHLRLGAESIGQNCELAQKLSEDFSDNSVVIRPHPHERIATYSERLQEMSASRVKVNRTGDIVPWMSRARMVLHRQCTTAIEAALAGIPAVAPLFVSTSADAPAAERVSFVCNTYDEVKEHAQAAIKGELEQTPEIKSALSSIVEEWIYKVDGESYQRVCDVVEEKATESKKQVSETKSKYWLYNFYQSKKGLKGLAYNSLSNFSQLTGFTAPLWSIDNYRAQSWKKSGKSFSESDVKSILNILGKYKKSGFSNLQVGGVEKSEAIDNFPSQSIKLYS